MSSNSLPQVDTPKELGKRVILIVNRTVIYLYKQIYIAVSNKKCLLSLLQIVLQLFTLCNFQIYNHTNYMLNNIYIYIYI